MAESITLEPPVEAAPRPAVPSPTVPPPAAEAALPSELEVRRRVERLLARALAEPSEELVRFVSVRLEVRAEGAAAERLAELCRRALREMGRERHRSPAPRSLERRHLDRRRVERSIPGYYLG